MACLASSLKSNNSFKPSPLRGLGPAESHRAGRLNSGVRPMSFLSLVIAATAASGGAMPDSAVMALVKDAGVAEKGTVLCLTIDGKDPSDQILSKIRTQNGAYVAGSKCRMKQGVLRHISNKKRGVRISFFDFRITSNGRATARIASYAGPLAGGSWTARLKLVGKTWAVESAKNNVIY